jgi:hypothetical protein
MAISRVKNEIVKMIDDHLNDVLKSLINFDWRSWYNVGKPFPKAKRSI